MTTTSIRSIVSLGILILSATVRSHAQTSGGAAGPASVIVASGAGEVSLHPDRALVTMSVVTRASGLGAATAANREGVALLLRALKRQGIPDASLSTTGFSVGRADAVGDPRFRDTLNYIARNSIRVSTTSFDDIGRLLDTALASGATDISGMVFRSSREGAARKEAIAMAVRDGLAEAAAVAEASGGVLGDILEIVVEPPRSLVLNLEGPAQYAPGRTPVTTIMPRDVVVPAQVRIRAALRARGT